MGRACLYDADGKLTSFGKDLAKKLSGAPIIVKEDATSVTEEEIVNNTDTLYILGNATEYNLRKHDNVFLLPLFNRRGHGYSKWRYTDLDEFSTKLSEAQKKILDGLSSGIYTKVVFVNTSLTGNGYSGGNFNILHTAMDEFKTSFYEKLNEVNKARKEGTESGQTFGTEKLSIHEKFLIERFRTWFAQHYSDYDGIKTSAVEEVMYLKTENQDLYNQIVEDFSSSIEDVVLDDDAGFEYFVLEKTLELENCNIDFPTYAEKKEAEETIAYYIADTISKEKMQQGYFSARTVKDKVRENIRQKSEENPEYLPLYENFNVLYESSMFLYKTYYQDFIKMMAKTTEQGLLTDLEEDTEPGTPQEERDFNIYDAFDDIVGKMSIKEGANATTKMLLSEVYECDEDGNPVLNKYGIKKRMTPSQIYAQLDATFIGIQSKAEMMERLRAIKDRADTLWVKDLIKKLEDNPTYQDSLFSAYNKGRIHYAAQYLQNGIIKTKIFTEDSSAKAILSGLTYNLSKLSLLPDSSVTKSATIYTNDSMAAYDLMDRLLFKEFNKELAKATKDDVLPNRRELVNKLHEIFRACGFILDNSVIEKIVDYIPNESDFPKLKDIKDEVVRRKYFLNQLYTRFKTIRSILFTRQKQGLETALKFTDIRVVAKNIANDIARTVSPDVQRSDRINGKTFYNSVRNSFVLTLDKYMFGENKDKFLKYVNTKLVNDPWYFNQDANAFYLPLLNDIFQRTGETGKVVNDAMRQGIQRVQVQVDINKKSIDKMNEFDVFRVAFNMFKYDLTKDNDPTVEHWAYYKDKLYGDSNKFYFTRLPKYIGRDFKEIIASKLADLVLQETHRIKRTFDKIEKEKNGEHISWVGKEKSDGVKYAFFPELNDYKYGENNFYQQLMSITNPVEKKNFIVGELTRRYIPEYLAKEREQLEKSGIFETPDFAPKSSQLIYYYQQQHQADSYSEAVGYNEILPLETLEKLKDETQRKIDALEYKKGQTTDKVLQSNILRNISELKRIMFALKSDISNNLDYHLDRFLLNSLLASIQMTELRDKDYIYYGSFTNYVKRSKQSGGDYSSYNIDVVDEKGNPINVTTDATGKRIIKTNERVMYLVDRTETISPEDSDAIDTILKEGIKLGIIGKDVADSFSKSWKDAVITPTDGQMYRTNISKRDIDAMLALDGAIDNNYKVYNAIINNKSVPEEYVKKAFTVKAVAKEFGYGIVNGVPTQLKNGTVTLNARSKHSGIFLRMPKFRALQKFMEENKIDCLCYTSGVKVGEYDSFNLENVDINDEDAVYNALSAQNKEMQSEGRVPIKEIPFETIGDQTTEHNLELEDLENTFGTQASKIIPAILHGMTSSITVGGQKLSPKEAYFTYHLLASNLLLRGWDELCKMMLDPKELLESLKASLYKSKKFNGEYLTGLTDYHGKPLIPYNDINTRGPIEDKLLAKIRKKVSKIPSHGGHTFVMSDDGFLPEQKLRVQYNKDGKNIDAVECALPLIYKELLGDLLVKDKDGYTFSIDIERLQRYKENGYFDDDGNLQIGAVVWKQIEKMLELVGYRVPTEGGCSMMALKIKYFLPISNTASIILPKEMVKQTGQDNDGDEVFLLIPEIKQYDMFDFIQDFGQIAIDKNIPIQEYWEKNREKFANLYIPVKASMSEELVKDIKDYLGSEEKEQQATEEFNETSNIVYDNNYTREKAASHPEYLHIFTDNTDRTSGSSLIYTPVYTETSLAEDEEISYPENLKFTTSKSTSYGQRTDENIRMSDVTLAFAVSFETGGEKRTAKTAKELGRYIPVQLPSLPNYISPEGEIIEKKKGSYEKLVSNTVNDILKGIENLGIKKEDIKINIAGNGIYTLSAPAYKQTQGQVDTFLRSVLDQLSKKIKIKEIRSGGQTGIDEAGAKAGASLGLNTVVHTTSDNKFRPSNNQDVSGNQQAFRERFGTIRKKEANQKKEAPEEIDIWAGSGGRSHPELSNMYGRQVEYNGITYPSVETAFQAQKYRFSKLSPASINAAMYQFSKNQGFAAKATGRRIPTNLEEWDKQKFAIMEAIIWEALQQNDEFRNALIETGDAILTHKKGDEVYSKKFPEILMRLRNRLLNKKETASEEEPSWYYRKYAKDKEGNIRKLYYPTQTTAVVRGLENAAPITTQRWYHAGAKGKSGQWNDSDFDEFSRVIEDDVNTIIAMWRTGNYEKIVLPGGVDGLFNGSISEITKERTPLLFAKLHRELDRLEAEVNKDSNVSTADIDRYRQQKEEKLLKIYKQIEGKSQEEVRNLFLDVVRNTLTSTEGSIETLKHNNYIDVKQQSLITRYINAVKPQPKENYDTFVDRIYKKVEELEKLDNDTLEKIVEKEEGQTVVNPSSWAAELSAMANAFTGKRSLAVFAVGKSTGSINLCSQLQLVRGIWFDGKELKSLHTAYHEDTQVNVSDTNAQFLAASPDHTKDPTLYYINVNETTRNVVQVFSQGGFKVKYISSFTGHPIIREIARTSKINGISARKATVKVLQRLAKELGIKDYKKAVKNVILSDKIDLSRATLLKAFIGDKFVSYTKQRPKKEKRQQIAALDFAVAARFLHMLSIGDEYMERNNALRPDSASGSAGSSCDETIARIEKGRSFNRRRDSHLLEEADGKPFIDTEFSPNANTSKESLVKHIFASKVPMIQSEFSLGLVGAINLCGEIFPEYKNRWKNVIESLSGENARVTREVYSYIWHNQLDTNPKEHTKEIARLIVETPFLLESLRGMDEFKSNSFIRDLYLSFQNLNGQGIEIPLIFSYSTSNKESVEKGKSITDGWVQLFNSENETARLFAEEMLKYFMYVYGNGYNAGSLASQRPTVIAANTPNYLKGLSQAKFNPTDGVINDFKEQYKKNHLDEEAVDIESLSTPELPIMSRFFYATYKNPNELYEAISKNEVSSVLDLPGMPEGVQYIKYTMESGDTILLEKADASVNGITYKLMFPTYAKIGGVKITNYNGAISAGEVTSLTKEIVAQASMVDLKSLDKSNESNDDNTKRLIESGQLQPPADEEESEESKRLSDLAFEEYMEGRQRLAEDSMFIEESVPSQDNGGLRPEDNTSAEENTADEDVDWMFAEGETSTSDVADVSKGYDPLRDGNGTQIDSTGQKKC